MSRNTFKAEPWTNKFGQLITPGDTVIYAGTAWKNTKLAVARYAGYYEGQYNKYVPDEQDNRKGKWVKTIGPVAIRVDGIKTQKSRYFPDRPPGQRLEYYDTARCAILPLMRVFKVDTNLKDLVGMSF